VPTASVVSPRQPERGQGDAVLLERLDDPLGLHLGRERQRQVNLRVGVRAVLEQQYDHVADKLASREQRLHQLQVAPPDRLKEWRFAFFVFDVGRVDIVQLEEGGDRVLVRVDRNMNGDSWC
jgi:hypothetical protein